MTPTSAVPTSGDNLSYRRDHWALVLAKAEPWHRGHLARLLDLWEEWNRDHYGQALVPPFIRLAPVRCPQRYGECARISSEGLQLEIRLRDTLLTGAHSHVRSGAAFAEGRFRFVADVLIHETIHQWQHEVGGNAEPAYHGHGPIFRDWCNRIGATLHLPPVRSAKKRGPDAHLPSCAQWPHNVRPSEHYLGAYVPPRGEGEGGDEERVEPPRPSNGAALVLVAQQLARLEKRLTKREFTGVCTLLGLPVADALTYVRLVREPGFRAPADEWGEELVASFVERLVSHGECRCVVDVSVAPLMPSMARVLFAVEQLDVERAR